MFVNYLFPLVRIPPNLGSDGVWDLSSYNERFFVFI